ESRITPSLEYVEEHWSGVIAFSLPSVGDNGGRPHIELGVKCGPEASSAALHHLRDEVIRLGGRLTPPPEKNNTYKYCLGLISAAIFHIMGMLQCTRAKNHEFVRPTKRHRTNNNTNHTSSRASPKYEYPSPRAGHALIGRIGARRRTNAIKRLGTSNRSTHLNHTSNSQ